MRSESAHSLYGSALAVCEHNEPAVGMHWLVRSLQLGVWQMRHRQWVRGADFSPDSKTVVTACFDRSARIWESTAATHLQNELPVRAAFFDLENQTLVTCGARSLKRWNISTGQQIDEPA